MTKQLDSRISGLPPADPWIPDAVHRELYARLPAADLTREIAELERHADTDAGVARKLAIARTVR